MATTSVDICNFALAHLKRPAIASLSDTSVEAVECNRLYAQARDTALYDHAWNFATKSKALALVEGLDEEEYSGWTYPYALPADCIRALFIFNSARPTTGTSYDIDPDSWNTTIGKVEFAIGTNTANDKNILMTNQEDAILFYTSRVETVTLYPPAFVDALALQLALRLAIPLTGDATKKKLIEADYLRVVGQAKATNAREGYEKPDTLSDFLSVR